MGGGLEINVPISLNDWPYSFVVSEITTATENERSEKQILLANESSK